MGMGAARAPCTIMLSLHACPPWDAFLGGSGCRDPRAQGVLAARRVRRPRTPALVMTLGTRLRLGAAQGALVVSMADDLPLTGAGSWQRSTCWARGSAR